MPVPRSAPRVAALEQFGGTVLKSSLSKEAEAELQDALHGKEQATTASGFRGLLRDLAKSPSRCSRSPSWSASWASSAWWSASTR